jgi:hypothetical protein
LYVEFYALLCVGCLNEWLSFVDNHPIQARRSAFQAEYQWVSDLAVARKPTTREHYLALETEELAIRREAFAVAAEFCKPIRREEP